VQCVVVSDTYIMDGGCSTCSCVVSHSGCGVVLVAMLYLIVGVE
jgi:hypothetical protein